MRRIRFFIYLCFLFSFQPLCAQNEVECRWYYNKDYVAEPALYQIGMEGDGGTSSCWKEECLYIEGKEVVNGRTYRKLYVDESSWGVKASSPFPNETDLYHEHILDIREEDGRVYALKQMYIDYLTHHASPEELLDHDIFLAPADNEDEILLYDFTLAEGDTYPSRGLPIVQRTGIIILRNSGEKKVLWLSNGIILVEDIGCVHSIGTLVCYQNEIVQEVPENPEVNGFLLGYLKSYSQGNDELFQCHSYASLFSDILHYPTAIRDLQAQPATGDSGSMFNVQRSTYYNLSGRRLSAPPAKGMYIEDKRVKIRE